MRLIFWVQRERLIHLECISRAQCIKFLTAFDFHIKKIYPRGKSMNTWFELIGDVFWMRVTGSSAILHSWRAPMLRR